MAKTIDNFSTIEDFRKTYNELAFDVGEKDGLRDGLKLGTNGTLVDALNILEDKKFFLQEYTYIATTNQQTFSGNDNFDVRLLFKKDKVQVFKNQEHLTEDIDYVVASPDGQGNHQAIVLQGDYISGGSKAMAANDRLTIYSYTGAFIGTQIAGTASSFFQKSAENTIFNTNANGVILNGDNSSATTTLESGFTLQLAGKTFAEDDIISTVAGKKFQAPIISDGTASLSSGSLTSAVNGTFSGQVQAEHLKSTDDLEVADGASFGGDIAVLGNAALFGSANQIGNSSSDVLEIQGDLNMTSAVITSNFIPKVDDNVTLGSSSKKWSNVHATALTGNLTGDVVGNVTGNVTGDLTGDVKHGGSVVLDASSGALTGTVSSISNHNTGDLSEGSNLYFTNARADARIAAANISALADVGNTSSASAGQILVFDGSGNLQVADNSTGTDSISEQTNKYFTDDRVNDTLIMGVGLSKSYADNPDGGTDTALDGRITMSVNTSNGVKIDGDDVELDYSVITDSDLSGGLPSGSGKSVGHLYFLV